MANNITAMRMIIETMRMNCKYLQIRYAAGNHGRVSFKHSKRTNWDMVVYKFIEVMYANYDDVFLDEGKRFVKIATVGNHEVLYTHGHIIRGMITRNKIIGKSNGWQRSRGHHDMVLLGHFHTTMMIKYNQMPIVINGCTYASPFIREQLGGMEDIQFTVIGVGEDMPLEWMELIDCE